MGYITLLRSRRDRPAKTEATGPAIRLADNLAMDLATVRGTGQGGKITVADVKKHYQENAPAASEEE